MPYLLLAFGLMIGIYGLYRFFLNADVKEIKAMIMAIAALIVGGCMILLALTGRLPAAIGILIVLLPFIGRYISAEPDRSS